MANEYLIDTHVFLWLLLSPERLAASTLETLRRRDNRVCLSTISLWEIALKFRLGKLELQGVLPDELPELAGRMDIELLPASAEELSGSYRLPSVDGHKDPFDRMIIWQAICRALTLVSRDDRMAGYARWGLRLLR